MAVAVFVGAGFLILGFGFLVWAHFAWAQEITVTNKPLASLATPPAASGLLVKIKEGITLLQKSAPLDYETKRTVVKKGLKIKSGDLVRKQIALAILNKNTGEILEKRVWVSEQDIKNYKKTGILELEPVDSGDGLDIQVQWWNSFNSFYEITGRPELVVVANKYLFPNEYLADLPERSSGKYTDIVYSPYSKQLHLPELIDAGRQYLEKQIDLAFGQLNTDGVISHSAPGLAATQSVTQDFIKNIILVEHMDPGAFALASDGGKELGERVLAVIGANQEKAYRYTGSPAGASGLAQFIKSTYNTTVAAYPQAHLIKNYHLGMADHVNAVKAMVLFFDSRKKEIAGRVVRRDIIESLGITEEMLAAAYNGGSGKVVRSVNAYGFAWLTGKIFRQETLDYIKKFQSVKTLDILANISKID